MELLLIRSERTEQSTIGDLFINGEHECFVLEDTDRGLRQDMPLEEIKEIKIKGKTAIPSGKYEIVISFSNKFKKYLPLLLSVPGYEGVRIHSGNTAADTEGCPLTGESKGNNAVFNSKKAFTKLFNKMKAVEKKEKTFITIQ